MTETITHIAAKKNREGFFTFAKHCNLSTKKKCLVIAAPQITEEQIITNDLLN
jgi:hypothetical protein